MLNTFSSSMYITFGLQPKAEEQVRPELKDAHKYSFKNTARMDDILKEA